MIPTVQKAHQSKICKLDGDPSATEEKIYEPFNPIMELTFSKKVTILKEIDEFCRSLDPNIKQVTATIASSTQKVFILRPNGSISQDIRPMVRLNISILLERNGRRETGYTGVGGRSNLQRFLKQEVWQNAAFEALRICLLYTSPSPRD